MEQATQFRQWATRILQDFAIHGHTAAELVNELGTTFPAGEE